MVTPLLRPMGERAVLAEVGDLAGVLALHAALAAEPPEGIEDLVPAARTVLVAFDPARITVAAVHAWIRSAAGSPAAESPPGPLVEVPLRYDGPDLDDTAEALGIRPPELIARHAAARWRVAFTGFAPGFAYLVSADWAFEVPRLAQPRTRVPAGSVGLAGEFTGAYPRETPGGWRLVGTTDAALFAPDAIDPVLLPPGARVRFVPERAAVAAAAPVASASRHEPGRTARTDAAPRADAAPALRILDPGARATVQDLGRPGRAGLGVSRSGALDRGALRIANRLVGNAEDAAGVEIVLGGFRARAERDVWVAVTGALADIRVDGRAQDAYAPLLLSAGAELSVGVARAGARLVLAVRGGIVAPLSFGSRATDTLASLGPAALRPGDVLRAGAAVAPVPVVDVFPWSVPAPAIDVPVTPGPRTDWFTPAALRILRDATWTVTGDADRVGIRLDGPALDRSRPDELPSEGMRPGALQVPPHGRPVVLLADGPVTGGYPVIAVVTDAALDRLAQLRPGDRVRFRGR